MNYHCWCKEDQILDKLVNYKTEGFFVDVGAWSPNEESVTRTFYDRGWNGINIEPQANRFNELCQFRKRDINLNLAVGDTEGELTLYLQDGCTTAVTDYVTKDTSSITIPMKTLTQILDSFAPNEKIDFLKIDVEGYEINVIKGTDWEKYRPTILCVECTIPTTTIPVWEEWDAILVENDYVLVDENAYNRFYKDVRSSPSHNLLGDSW